MTGPLALGKTIFAFRTEVRLNANAAPAGIVARLAEITAPPWSCGRMERRKPLRGRAAADRGLLRWPLYTYQVASLRALEFQILEDHRGSVLVGKFRILTPVRIVALCWVCFGIALRGFALIREILRGAPLRDIGISLLAIGGGWCMAYGYLWFAVRVGRGRDRMLIRVLRAVLASEAGAKVVKNLPSSDENMTFVDPPIVRAASVGIDT